MTEKLGRTIIGNMLCPHPDTVDRWSKEAMARRRAFMAQLDEMLGTEKPATTKPDEPQPPA